MSRLKTFPKTIRRGFTARGDTFNFLGDVVVLEGNFATQLLTAEDVKRLNSFLTKWLTVYEYKNGEIQE